MNFIEEKIVNKGTDKNLITRFPPEPNGYLHIGHAKSMVLNFGLAEKYNGKCVLRFDDTNPLAEEDVYVKSITEDVSWLLGYKPEVKYTSDYFDFIRDCAIELIKKGLAYIDFSTSEEIAEMKGTPTTPGKNSIYRHTSPNDNLNLFNTLLRGGLNTKGVLRAKIDMSSPNMLLRDPVIYRSVDGEHHRTGDTWKMYPMYDFAHPLSDLYENVTDSLCTLEFEVHRPLYNWVIDNCKHLLPTNNTPEQTEFNRLNIGYTVLSKRKLKELVDNNIVNGWDDPRMPTISGLRRRGYTPTSIRNFCEKAGWTKRDTLTDYALLESCLREELNKTTNRYMGVIDPIKLTITNYEKPNNNGLETVTIENNPEDESAGSRTVFFSNELYIEREDFKEEANNKYFRLKLGGEVRLKGAYIVKAYDCIKDENGNIVEVLCTYDPETKSGMTDRKVKGTIHWVDRNSCIEMEVRDYDRLFNVEKPDGISDINENSLIIRKGYAELDVLNIKKVPFQFMRKGYYIKDTESKDYTKLLDGKLIFNKSVSLKEGW